MHIPRHKLDTDVHNRLRSSSSLADQLQALIDITDGQRPFTAYELRQIKAKAETLRKLHAEMQGDLALMIASVDQLAAEAA